MHPPSVWDDVGGFATGIATIAGPIANIFNQGTSTPSVAVLPAPAAAQAAQTDTSGLLIVALIAAVLVLR